MVLNSRLNRFKLHTRTPYIQYFVCMFTFVTKEWKKQKKHQQQHEFIRINHKYCVMSGKK